MINRRRVVQYRWMIACLALCIGSQVLAQSRPTPLGPNITSNSNLKGSPDQLQTVTRYVEYWTGVLKNTASKPEEVETARTELTRPLRNPGVSNSFRYEYSYLMAPRLREAVETNNCHIAVNALIVAAEAAADHCLNVLLDHVDINLQPMWQIRLQAASGCVAALQTGEWQPRKIMDAAKRVRDAAEVETNPLILRHQLAALLAADIQSLKPEERQQVRTHLVSAMAAAVNRAETDSERDRILEAVTLTMIQIRNRFIDNMSDAERRTIGPALGPVLGKMMSIASAHWESAQADPHLKKTYGVTIGACQGFLARIHALSGGQALETQVREAWDAGDKAKFDAELQKWLAVLKQPPYTQAG